MTAAEEVQAIRDESDAHHENTLANYVKIILFVTVVLVIVGAVSVIRSVNLQSSVDQLTSETDELQIETGQAKAAAVEARDVLQAALERSSTQNPDAIANALSAISRIEQELCGGPCD